MNQNIEFIKKQIEDDEKALASATSKSEKEIIKGRITENRRWLNLLNGLNSSKEQSEK